MSWHYLREVAGESLEDICLGGEPLPLLKSKTTHAEFYCKGKLMDSYLDSLYGMTSAPLMDTPGEAKSMLSAGVFPVRTSPLQEKEMDSMVSGQDSGQKWRGWLAKFDPLSCSWRIAQCSLLEEECELLQSLPRWGMTRDGLLWEQPMWEHHTKGTEFGLLPDNESFFHTPNTTGMDGGSNSRKALRKRMETMPTPNSWDGKRGPMSKELMETGKHQVSLVTYVKHNPERFPTPTASDHKDQPTSSSWKAKGAINFKLSNPEIRAKWGTPKAQDSRHALWDRGKSNLGEQVSGLHNGGKLNPNWVEWLMGWPIGWTDLKPLGTDKSPSALHPLGDS